MHALPVILCCECWLMTCTARGIHTCFPVAEHSSAASVPGVAGGSSFCAPLISACCIRAGTDIPGSRAQGHRCHPGEHR